MVYSTVREGQIFMMSTLTSGSIFRILVYTPNVKMTLKCVCDDNPLFILSTQQHKEVVFIKNKFEK